jgi:hypothetical protein
VLDAHPVYVYFPTAWDFEQCCPLAVFVVDQTGCTLPAALFVCRGVLCYSLLWSFDGEVRPRSDFVLCRSHSCCMQIVPPEQRGALLQLGRAQQDLRRVIGRLLGF